MAAEGQLYFVLLLAKSSLLLAKSSDSECSHNTFTMNIFSSRLYKAIRKSHQERNGLSGLPIVLALLDPCGLRRACVMHICLVTLPPSPLPTVAAPEPPPGEEKGVAQHVQGGGREV